jgi:hypothetical protein
MINCGYRNGSDRMVIVRCVGPEGFFHERVVFPFELLSFSCPPESRVEIWSHGLGGAELVETLSAQSLLLEPCSPTADLCGLEGGLDPVASLGDTPWLEAG